MNRVEQMIAYAARAGHYRQVAKTSSRVRAGWLKMASKYSLEAARLAQEVFEEADEVTRSEAFADGDAG